MDRPAAPRRNVRVLGDPAFRLLLDALRVAERQRFLAWQACRTGAARDGSGGLRAQREWNHAAMLRETLETTNGYGVEPRVVAAARAVVARTQGRP